MLVQELDTGRGGTATGGEGVLKLVTAGALPVLARTIQCLEEELAIVSEKSTGESEGTSPAPHRNVLLRNLQIATNCAHSMMRCGISSDSAEIKLFCLKENVNAEDSGGVSSAGPQTQAKIQVMKETVAVRKRERSA